MARPPWFPYSIAWGPTSRPRPQAIFCSSTSGVGSLIVGPWYSSGAPNHLVPVGLEGPAALGVLGGEDASFLVTEGAGAGGRLQEAGEGHGM